LREISVSEGSIIVELEAVAESAGVHSYRLTLNTDTDTLSENNESYAYLKVDGESTVLIIADTLSHAAALEEVLSAENMVTTVTAYNAPKSIIELCNYDEVILSNVNYDNLPSGYDKLLDTYVSVYGRSLLAVGGSDTFMYGNMEGTALEEILPVTFTLSESSEGNSVAMMLVLDCSSRRRMLQLISRRKKGILFMRHGITVLEQLHALQVTCTVNGLPSGLTILSVKNSQKIWWKQQWMKFIMILPLPQIFLFGERQATFLLQQQATMPIMR